MGAAAEPAVERESEGGGRGAKEEEEEVEGEVKSGGEESKDVERGEVGFQGGVAGSYQNPTDFRASMLQSLDSTNPLRIVINGGRRVTTPSPAHASIPRSTPPPSHGSVPRSTPPPPHVSVPRSTPTPQSIATLNSRNCTNKLSLFLFLLHLVIAVGLVGFLVFKGVQGLIEASEDIKRKEKALLKYFVPQAEVASFLSITLAFAWQKAVRVWPKFMVHFILWSTFGMSLSAGVLLLCFQTAPTDGVGVCFIAFAIGNGLYACWVSQRTRFCCSIFLKSLEPVSKFPDINQPTYAMLGAGFLWMSLWLLAVIGALNFYLRPLIIIVLVLSLAWVTEVMRNIANITVSRVIALYYLRGMQSTTHICLQRALTYNLGSACFGSLFVPTIEALRIVARGLNLLQGEDEFMFSCAHCCLRVMDFIFRHGNGWAFVQIAAYGKGFVKASQDTWELFEKQEMESIVDSDITSSICFLTGVCSGSICVIVVAAWTVTVRGSFTATISLLAFFVGYLMTRIAMALPHACVSCYYVCYAENPENRLFDKTIKDHLNMIKSEQEVVVPTPRVPIRFRRA
ncbi:uncharacterized protein LOC115684952 isoform X2 [Syzygium oleosum]|uniref:uncharacterized protein LOC115684952 isoform X2 n=1 Tax=Syzygium oleosum TaxID=219896 RepID=UPI0024BAE247|nr:uncharacterized protein LOC115684952 isoform X2 [Syzygium oleosum]